MANVVYHADVALKDLGGGVSRRVLAYTPQLMIVEVNFEKGGEGSVHTHPHSQSTYVLSGRFRYTVEDESAELLPGDSIVVPGGLTHGTECLEAGALLDIFTPMREDFVK